MSLIGRDRALGGPGRRRNPVGLNAAAADRYHLVGSERGWCSAPMLVLFVVAAPEGTSTFTSDEMVTVSSCCVEGPTGLRRDRARPMRGPAISDIGEHRDRVN